MKKYTHEHHIIPKHMGGDESPSNLIKLTIEEHACEHKKLFKKFRKAEDFLAWKCLCGINSNVEENRRKLAKINFRKMLKDPERSKRWKENISKGLMGHKQTKETKEKRSKTMKEGIDIGRIKMTGAINPHIPNKKQQKKMSIGRKNSKLWNEKVRSTETQDKKRLSSKNKVGISVNGIIFESIRQASKNTEFHYNYLLRIKNGEIHNDRISFI